MDRVERQFQVTGPNELWVADSAYNSSLYGIEYLVVIQDLFSAVHRRLVDGFSATSGSHDTSIENGSRATSTEGHGDPSF